MTSVGGAGSPIARRLIFPAAETYASTSVDEMPSAPAMLSKPCVESSDGRYFPASTRSASRSSIAFGLEPRDHLLVDGRFRTPRIHRRHHPRAHLADDQLELVGVPVDVLEVN